MRFRRRALWGLLILLPCAATIAHAGEIRYRGREISDKKSGLTLLPVKEMNAVAASSLVHHYFVVLPTAGEWRLESSKDVPLSGSDGRFEVTLMAADDAASPSAYLQGLLSKMQAVAELKIRDPQILEERGYQILRYQAQMAGETSIPDAWQWNYWTVAFHDGHGIAMHLSTMDQSIGTSGEEQRIRTLLTSLRADFKR